MGMIIRGRLSSYDSHRPPEPRIEVAVVNPSNNKLSTIHALIDTGATTAVLPFDMAFVLGLDVSTMTKVERHTAGGVKTAFIAAIDLIIGDEKRTVDFDFVLDWSVPILGYNILSSCKLSIDYQNGTFELAQLSEDEQRREL